METLPCSAEQMRKTLAEENKKAACRYCIMKTQKASKTCFAASHFNVPCVCIEKKIHLSG